MSNQMMKKWTAFSFRMKIIWIKVIINLKMVNLESKIKYKRLAHLLSPWDANNPDSSDSQLKIQKVLWKVKLHMFIFKFWCSL